jgi:lysophospholipase L1-like esterase
MNKYLKNFLVLFVSVILALLVTEGLARLFFDPIDFLKPKIVNDEVLRYKIEPNSGAHDSWGYRNKKVPQTAKIVAIGDSHTYGISATASNSWPAFLQRISSKDTYNLSLGGYGPAEYFYLMEDKALELDPEMIIVGFYLGNDLKDSFNAVYSVSIWEDLRDLDISYSFDEDENNKEANSESFTDWLSANSVLYRIISSSFIGDNLRQQRRISKGEDIPILDLPEHGINTGFTPDRRLEGLDLSTPEVREGLSLTLEYFNRMNQLAREKQVGFLVVIIPTKEGVFSEFISKSDELSESYKLDKLIQNEEVVSKLVQRYFVDHEIPYLDVLGPLKNAAGSEQIYPNNFGGHSNKNGYRIIAESINKYLESKDIH